MGKGWRALGTWLTGKAKLALILPLTLAMAATATADTVPQVTLATPGSSGTGDGTITRFTLRFSEDMVPLGDPRAPAPATNDCKLPSSSRWVDTRTWVLEFDKPLPGGLACHVELRDGLTTARGVAVAGNSRFALDTGGPSARAVLVGGMGGGIEEEQIFLVATNVAAERASVGRYGYCAVDGIGEKIPLDVLPRETATEILTGLGDNNWSRQSFTYDAGLPQRGQSIEIGMVVGGHFGKVMIPALGNEMRLHAGPQPQIGHARDVARIGDGDMLDPVPEPASGAFEQGQRKDQLHLADAMDGNPPALRMGSLDEGQRGLEIGQGGFVQVQLGRTAAPRAGFVCGKREAACQHRVLPERAARELLRKMLRDRRIVARGHVGDAGNALTREFCAYWRKIGRQRAKRLL